MSWFLRHPRYSALNRFADGELDTKDHDRVARHLADCARCRAEVIFIRNAGGLARTLATPPAPEGALEVVLARRQDGERALLPPTPRGAAPERRRAAPVIAALIALFLVGLMVSYVPLLEAGDPGLRITPERPQEGARLTIEYSGSQLFADQSRLRLRARTYAVDDRRGAIVEHLLHRDGDTFRGEIQLPDSIRFAVFAVEDMEGARLDSNTGSLWEVLVHGADGKPTEEALAARVLHHSRTDPEMATRAVISLTRMYPESARGWALRMVSELYRSEPEFVLREYTRRNAAFERLLDEGWVPSTRDRTWLAVMALTLGDLPTAERWLTETTEGAEGERLVYDARAVLAILRHWSEPERLLMTLDSVWVAAPTLVGAAADAGWKAALEVRSWEEAQRWLPRYAQAREGLYVPGILTALADAFGPRRALEWGTENRDRLAAIGARGPRPLTQTRPRYERLARRDDQRTLAALASLAVSVGDAAVARDLASDGLTLAWSTDVLVQMGGILLASGDTSAAATAFARAAADPTGPEPPAVIRRSADWTRRLEIARDELTRETFADAVVRYVDPAVVVPETGEALALSEAIHGGPAVVAFLTSCPRDTAALQHVASQLAGRRPRPGAVVVIAARDDPWLPDRLRECGLNAPVYLDPGGAARTAFRSTGSPQYFVLGPDGRLRFERTPLAEVSRQLLALDRIGAGRTGRAD
jgi:hypothetical protein